MNTPRNFPIRLVIFSGPCRGKVVATIYPPHGLTDWVDWAEVQAERMASEWGAEIDIQTGTIFPSGKIASWERAGLRVRP